MLSIKKSDYVVIISGKEKGKKGKVLAVNDKGRRLLVEGMNKVKRHLKPSKQFPEGGIIEKESSIHISNIMLYCKKCNKGVRYRNHIVEKNRKVKLCSKCGESL